MQSCTVPPPHGGHSYLRLIITQANLSTFFDAEKAVLAKDRRGDACKHDTIMIHALVQFVGEKCSTFNKASAVAEQMLA
jgi:hypothetical protein